jgi:hypothetical protein
MFDMVIIKFLYISVKLHHVVTLVGIVNFHGLINRYTQETSKVLNGNEAFLLFRSKRDIGEGNDGRPNPVINVDSNQVVKINCRNLGSQLT